MLPCYLAIIITGAALLYLSKRIENMATKDDLLSLASALLAEVSRIQAIVDALRNSQGVSEADLDEVATALTDVKTNLESIV